jgi:hypothetical protein
MKNKFIKEVLKWINSLNKDKSLSMWLRNIEIYIDGNKIFSRDNEWHHVAIVAEKHMTEFIDELQIKEGEGALIRLEKHKGSTKPLLHQITQ